MNTQDSNTDQQLMNLFERYRQAWLAQPVGEGMQELYDKNHDDLVYLAEELESALTTWQEIDAYWGFVPPLFTKVHEFTPTTLRTVISGDSALIYAEVRVVIELAGVPGQKTNLMRATLGAHRVDGEWKLNHYHESARKEVPDAYRFDRVNR